MLGAQHRTQHMSGTRQLSPSVSLHCHHPHPPGANQHRRGLPLLQETRDPTEGCSRPFPSGPSSRHTGHSSPEAPRLRPFQVLPTLVLSPFPGITLPPSPGVSHIPPGHQGQVTRRPRWHPHEGAEMPALDLPPSPCHQPCPWAPLTR